MRNQLNELKPCEIHPGHFADYCIAGFMKQMQCNVTPSLNIIKTTAKQVWLSVLNIRRTTRPGYTGTTTILKPPQKILAKFSYPKTSRDGKFQHPPPQKKAFDYPRDLKSGVPPPPPPWDLLASGKPQHLETRPVY